MFPQRDAILRLLGDDDRETVASVKRQLTIGGSRSIPDLQDLLHTDNVQAARNVREVLANIDSVESGHAFAALCATPDPDLEEACWLLARALLPGVRTDPYAAQLDEWGGMLRDSLALVSDPTERVAALTHLLCEDLGFAGNTEDFHNIYNSLLPAVIDTRLGIPISLSILHLLVGRRAGMDISGINLPGHFLVLCDGLLLDPFHQGRVLDFADCAEILARQRMRLEVRHLQPAATRTILVRVLANLLGVFESEQNEERKAQIAGWMRLFEPHNTVAK